MIYDIKKFYLMVWKTRDEIEQYWPTPSTEDSLRFAFTESAEALDAQLRLNATYQRNRSVEPDPENVLDEMADCCFMLLTALGASTPIYKPKMNIDLDLDQICREVAGVWQNWENRRINPRRWITLCISVVNSIANYPGMNLEERLQARLDRIKAKHAPQERIDPIQTSA